MFDIIPGFITINKNKAEKLEVIENINNLDIGNGIGVFTVATVYINIKIIGNTKNLNIFKSVTNPPKILYISPSIYSDIEYAFVVVLSYMLPRSVFKNF
tara:strand:- start:135 stop:431 length:297 start_codon:yes stop_codon:yes gene_type:complete